MRHVPLFFALFAAFSPFSASHAGAQPPITLEAPAMDEAPVPRLRIGAELGGGIAYGATEGGVLGIFGQLGAQITQQLGVFYQPALLGYGFGDDENVSTFLVSSHSAMVDLTFNNVAQVGIGGGLDFGSFSYCSDRTGACFAAGNSVNPSMSIRAAFLVGFVRNRARWGIPIALQVHTMLWDHRSQNHLMITVGFSRY
jgi:hypothetical protein